MTRTKKPEMPAENLPETVAEAPAEVAAETPTEAVDEVPFDLVEEASAEVVIDVPVEVADDATPEVMPQAPAEAMDEAPAELVEEAPADEVIDAPVEVADDATPEFVAAVVSEVTIDEPTKSPMNIGKVEDLIHQVEWLNQTGHRDGLIDELRDLHGAELHEHRETGHLILVLAGIEGGSGDGRETALRNWCQIARGAVAEAKDAELRASIAAQDAIAGVAA